MMSKLYLLRPVNDDCWPVYDASYGFVIRAQSEIEARSIAHKNGGDENGYCYDTPWMSEKYSTCVELPEDGPSKLIIEDFNAG